MSWITNVTITVLYDDYRKPVRPTIERGYTTSGGWQVFFTRFDPMLPQFTGHKTYTADLYAGSFNYLDITEFRNWITEVLLDTDAVVVIDEEQQDPIILQFKGQP